MGPELNLSDAQFGLASGIFFCSYCAMQVPIVFILSRVGGRHVLAVCLLGWGVLSALTGLVHSYWQLYVLRFLLGIFEAGYYPGSVLYISTFFPDCALSSANTIFTLAASVGSAGGSLSAGFILDAFPACSGNAFATWAGWRLLFFIQGIPAIGIGLLFLFTLPNTPHDATWLSPTERELLLSQLSAEVLTDERTDDSIQRGASEQQQLQLPFVQAVLTVLRRPTTYLFGMTHYVAATLGYLNVFFMPQLWHEVTTFPLGVAVPLTCAAMMPCLLARRPPPRSRVPSTALL